MKEVGGGGAENAGVDNAGVETRDINLTKTGCLAVGIALHDCR